MNLRVSSPASADDESGGSMLSIDYWKKQVLVREPSPASPSPTPTLTSSPLTHSSPIKTITLKKKRSPTLSSLNNRRFVFDTVFCPEDSQIEMSSHLMLGDGLLMHVLDGRDACVFAYGQNRNGKWFFKEGKLINNNFKSNCFYFLKRNSIRCLVRTSRFEHSA